MQKSCHQNLLKFVHLAESVSKSGLLKLWVATPGSLATTLKGVTKFWTTNSFRHH